MFIALKIEPKVRSVGDLDIFQGISDVGLFVIKRHVYSLSFLSFCKKIPTEYDI